MEIIKKIAWVFVWIGVVVVPLFVITTWTPRATAFKNLESLNAEEFRLAESRDRLVWRFSDGENTCYVIMGERWGGYGTMSCVKNTE